MRGLENRIPPPLVMLLVALAMTGLAYVTPGLAIAAPWRTGSAALLALFGLCVSGSGVLAFRQAKTTINPVDIEAASALVTGRIFAYTRNPMYLGMTCLLVSLMIYLAAPLTIIGPLAFVAYITRFQIMPEERVMRAKFGAVYDAYQRQTRRWV
jgi:protein-S-isoprenylcysteine O-methyltransferase Ste14